MELVPNIWSDLASLKSTELSRYLYFCQIKSILSQILSSFKPMGVFELILVPIGLKFLFSLVSYTAPLPALSRSLSNTAFTLFLMIMLKKINGSINNQEWSFQVTSTMINNLCSLKLKALVKSSVKSCTHLVWEYQSRAVWQFNLRKSVSTKFPYYVPHQ